jgi:hypothetical protein
MMGNTIILTTEEDMFFRPLEGSRGPYHSPRQQHQIDVDVGQ